MTFSAAVPTASWIHLRFVTFQCISLLPLSSLSMRIHDHTSTQSKALLLFQVPRFLFPFSLLLNRWKVNIYLCFKGIQIYTRTFQSLKKELTVNNGGPYASELQFFSIGKRGKSFYCLISCIFKIVTFIDAVNKSSTV